MFELLGKLLEYASEDGIKICQETDIDIIDQEG